MRLLHLILDIDAASFICYNYSPLTSVTAFITKFGLHYLGSHRQISRIRFFTKRTTVIHLSPKNAVKNLVTYHPDPTRCSKKSRSNPAYICFHLHSTLPSSLIEPPTSQFISVKLKMLLLKRIYVLNAFTVSEWLPLYNAFLILWFLHMIECVLPTCTIGAIYITYLGCHLIV